MHIRLQYMYFLEAKLIADTIRDICNLSSLAISWRTGILNLVLELARL